MMEYGKNMKKKNDRRETLDDYISIAKTDVYVYLVVTLISLTVWILTFIKQNEVWYIKLFFIVVLTLCFFGAWFIGKIRAYYNLNKIKKYLIVNGLIDKIGKILYWNEEYYFLTDNYFVIYQNKKTTAFLYSDIKEIYKTYDYSVGHNSHYSEKLVIILKNNKEFSVIIYSTLLFNEEMKDISDFLVSKNKNIIISDKNRK